VKCAKHNGKRYYVIIGNRRIEIEAFKFVMRRVNVVLVLL